MNKTKQKLSNEKIEEIKVLLDQSLSYSDISKETSVSKSTISKIKNKDNKVSKDEYELLKQSKDKELLDAFVYNYRYRLKIIGIMVDELNSMNTIIKTNDEKINDLLISSNKSLKDIKDKLVSLYNSFNRNYKF